jgi:predicted anti-sigma-YlaC factor YlaD
MECERVRVAVSARLDHEDTGLEDAVIDRHLATCVACRRFAETAAGLVPLVRDQPADPAPDLTPTILAAIRQEPAFGRERLPRFDPAALRWGLLCVAVVQLLLGAPALLAGADGDTPTHLVRELGAFDFALAVGFLFAAWRPSRAFGMLPLVAALVACLGIVAVLDVAQGRSQLAHETAHLLELLGLVFVWQLARSRPEPERRQALFA